MKRAKTVCFTGHRALAAVNLDAIQNRIERVVEALTLLDFTNYLCGGAIGFDTLAGFAVMRVRSTIQTSG